MNTTCAQGIDKFEESVERSSEKWSGVRQQISPNPAPSPSHPRLTWQMQMPASCEDFCEFTTVTVCGHQVRVPLDRTASLYVMTHLELSVRVKPLVRATTVVSVTRPTITRYTPRATRRGRNIVPWYRPIFLALVTMVCLS